MCLQKDAIVCAFVYLQKNSNELVLQRDWQGHSPKHGQRRSSYGISQLRDFTYRFWRSATSNFISPARWSVSWKPALAKVLTTFGITIIRRSTTLLLGRHYWLPKADRSYIPSFRICITKAWRRCWQINTVTCEKIPSRALPWWNVDLCERGSETTSSKI